MLATGLLFFQAMAGYLISQIQEKIDITAYFKEEISEQDILEAREEILKMSPDIKDAKYVSRQEAMRIFTEKHKDDNTFLRALEEVGANPFLASLDIKTNGEPAQYEEISNILQTAEFSKLIDKVDFSQKKNTIEKVFSITSNINKFSLFLGLILIIIAVMVVFSTIKLAIDSSKEEISTMRIVGASNWFIRGPFIIQGAIYGFLAFLLCILISFLSVYLISPKLGAALPGFSLLDYFLNNFWFFALMQLGFGIGLGAISSFIVVRKYLNI
ncbi:MAG: cell division protein [Parcubacteria group bacterium Licking1014_1]|nr:MAG: cell division protein [Parcubacteria group bacterium Licking1014_1]